MIISLQNKHIKKAGRSSKTCPIALAIREKFNDQKLVFVHPEGITITGFKTILPTRSVVRFINRYDSYLPVKPFNFKLEVEEL